VCEQAIDPTGGESFEPVGFGVEGLTAWRQWGRVSLVVDGEWLVTWSDTPRLRRVDPPANVRQPGFVAAFAYDALPASLPLRLRPRRSRVVIEPEYRYDVAGTRVTLDAKFRVAARGAAVGGVVIGIDPTWVIDEIGPPGAVDAAGATSEDGVLSVPFAQPLTGDIVLSVRATLPVETTAERVAWNLPTPRADVVGPAVVAIGARTRWRSPRPTPRRSSTGSMPRRAALRRIDGFCRGGSRPRSPPRPPSMPRRSRSSRSSV